MCGPFGRAACRRADGWRDRRPSAKWATNITPPLPKALTDIREREGFLAFCLASLHLSPSLSTVIYGVPYPYLTSYLGVARRPCVMSHRAYFLSLDFKVMGQILAFNFPSVLSICDISLYRGGQKSHSQVLENFVIAVAYHFFLGLGMTLSATPVLVWFQICPTDPSPTSMRK